MRLCLIVVTLVSISLGVADILTPISYNVQETNSFKLDFNNTKIKYTLKDLRYTGNKSDGYLRNGVGKLTDGLFGYENLPEDKEVTASDSRWLSWVFKGNSMLNLNMYFTFDEDKLIESVSINSLSQQFSAVKVDLYTRVVITLLNSDNKSVAFRVGHGPPNRDVKIHNHTFDLQKCGPCRIVELKFERVSVQHLIFGEIQFTGESAINVRIPTTQIPASNNAGLRIVISCISNRPDTVMYHDGKQLNCKKAMTVDNDYNCSITKERIGFNDGGEYRCKVAATKAKCGSSEATESISVKGIFADILEERTSIGSMTMLSCHSASVHGSINFQKNNSEGRFISVHDSTNHQVSRDTNGVIKNATLTFYNVTQADVGVYRCYYEDTSEKFISQDMRLSIDNVPMVTPSYKRPGSVDPVSSRHPTSSQFTTGTTSSSYLVSTSDSSNTTSPVGEKHGGVGGGIIAGIVFAILLIIMIIVGVVIYILWRHRRPHKENVVTGIRYDKKESTNGTDPAYDTPGDIMLYMQSGSGRMNGTENSYNVHTSQMPLQQVSFRRFAQQQVNESPDYAEAETVVNSRAKTMPSDGSVVTTNLQTARNRQASMPPKLGIAQLMNCQQVNDSVVYSEPAIRTGSKRSQPVKENGTQRHSSRDSGLGHDHDTSPNHVYERVPRESIIEDPSLVHRQVADLAIYASLDEINHHSQVAARQSVIEMDEDLSPELILSFHESASLVSSSSNEGILPYLSVYADPAPLLQSDGPPEMPPEKFSQHRRIGQGQFGDVFQAFAKSILVEQFIDGQLNGLCVKDIPVALKCLRAGATKDMEEAFNKEVKFMAHLRHQHVVRLLGVCSMVQPKFMVIEYMENGDLNQYLQQFEFDEKLLEEGKQLISYKVLVSMAADVASGMEYLASKFFIHRDLATRNCLVGQNYVVKIADFGMTRSVYEKNYYRLAGRAILPIRWMAPECFYGKFTMMSDIWAYGVTCWEIFTLAREQPFQDLEDKEVIENAVRREGRMLLDRPACCDDPMFELVLDCWNEAPELRPSFTEICERLRWLAESF